MAKKNTKSTAAIPQVTDAEIAAGKLDSTSTGEPKSKAKILTPGAFKLWSEVVKLTGLFRWFNLEAMFAANGEQALDEAGLGRIYGRDESAPETVQCSDLEGTDHACTATVNPHRAAVVLDDGSLMTNKTYVSESNPEGVVYRGSYISVRNNGQLVAKPFCTKHTEATLRTLGDAYHKKFFAQTKDQCDARIAAIGAGLQNRSEEDRLRREQLGIKDRPAFNSPRQGQRRLDRRPARDSRGISNRD